MIMNTENTFGHRTKKVLMFFKNIKRWDVIKRFNKDIPGSNCIREKLFMYLFDLHIISRKVLRVLTLNKALQFGGSLSFR